VSPSETGGFVRPARAADADSLVRVQVASWRCGYAGIVPSDLLAELTGDSAQGVWLDRWREAITNPPTSRHRVLVAVSETPDTPASLATPATSAREVVGFVSAGPATDADRWPGTDGELYELRVAPERTGQGHGSRLLHAAADTLSEDGFHTVSIWALAADSALRGFLESSGWAPDGARAELDVGTSVPVVRLHTRISE
jgi:ribosomal protein S18 acetylase RimI-like enzyme